MLICCPALTVHWASVIGEYHHMGQWKSWEKPMVSRFQAMLRTINLNYRIGTEHNTCLNMNNGWWTNTNQYWNEPIIIVPAYEHQPIWTNCTRSTQVMGWSISLLRVLGTTRICFPDRKTKRMGKLWVRNAETIWTQHLDIWWVQYSTTVAFNNSGIKLSLSEWNDSWNDILKPSSKCNDLVHPERNPWLTGFPARKPCRSSERFFRSFALVFSPLWPFWGSHLWMYNNTRPEKMQALGQMGLSENRLPPKTSKV